MDPVSIATGAASLICGSTCCLAVAGGIGAAVYKMTQAEAEAAAPVKANQKAAKPPAEAKAKAGGPPSDFAEEDEPATVVAPPPPGVLEELPQAPPPPPPDVTEEAPKGANMPSLSDVPAPRRAPMRSSGQTIIAFDDDDDDDF